MFYHLSWDVIQAFRERWIGKAKETLIAGDKQQHGGWR